MERLAPDPKALPAARIDGCRMQSAMDSDAAAGANGGQRRLQLYDGMGLPLPRQDGNREGATPGWQGDDLRQNYEAQTMA